MLTRGAVGDDLSSYILTTHAGDPDQVPNLWLWSDTAATVSGDKESLNLPVSALIKQKESHAFIEKVDDLLSAGLLTRC